MVTISCTVVRGGETFRIQVSEISAKTALEELYKIMKEFLPPTVIQSIKK